MSGPGGTTGWTTLFLVFLVVSLEAVDRNNFKKCDQSGFCKRHRGIKDTGYNVQEGTLRWEGATLTATLVGPPELPGEEAVHLQLTVQGLTNARVRVIIDEPSGAIRPRFVPNFALDGEPELAAFKGVGTGVNEASIRLADGRHTARVIFSPFRIDLLDGNEIVTQVNRDGRLKLERFRTKEEGKEYPAGFWEESFKSHTDSKPYGSSSVGVDVTFVGADTAFGLPEHADSFALRATREEEDPIRLYNLDVFEYEIGNVMSLYVAVPFLVAPSNNKTLGALWLNSAETWIDTWSSRFDKGVLRSMLDRVLPSEELHDYFQAHFISESGRADLFLFLGDSPSQVSQQYALTTGTMPLPPMFALAYHQCRWNYNDEADVQSVNLGFDTWDLPMDVIWLDIEHTDGKRYFTWDKLKFPTPKDMIGNVAARGRKMVTIVDPHIKKDPAYRVYQDAKELGYFVRRAGNESDFEGHCWPGASEYLDYFNPLVRDYWAAQFAFDRYEGSTGDLFTWNDMNEPSVFSGPEVTMDKDSLHFGGVEHREVHNAYGFMQHEATWKGLLQRTAGKERPFVLTRSGFIGSQRYAAIWTGDNAAEWSHLAAAAPMLLSLSISGIPLVGADVGGFFKNPNEELLVRWYQTAAFQPFFRGHAHIDTKRREPWLFSEDTRLAIRSALRARYALLPFWYQLFAEHSRTGAPPMRPLWYEFGPSKDWLFEEAAWMLGNALLVRPVVEEGARSVKVLLPNSHKDIWYDWHTRVAQKTDTVFKDVPLDSPTPVFQRGGTIVPTWERVRRASSLMLEDPLTLWVAVDSHGGAKGSVYIDDGHSLDYAQGHFVSWNITLKTESPSRMVLSGSASGSSWKAKNVVERVSIAGVTRPPREVSLRTDDGKERLLQAEHDRDRSLLVLRKPVVAVGREFRIEILF